MRGVAEVPSLRIQVTLVHHGAADRVGGARDTARLVSTCVSALGDVSVREVWRQPLQPAVHLRTLMGRRVRQWRLERRWSRHLRVGGRWALSTGLLIIRLAQLLSPGNRESARRTAFVELALSAKHEFAWRQANEDDVDLLIVLEDDARSDEHSCQRIRQLLTLALEDGGLQETYIDLAGGMPWDELRLSSVAVPRGDGIISLSQPATNTTCAYALGRDLIGRLAGVTMSEPASTRLPADWLINSVFMDAAKGGDGSAIRCLHSTPHALQHGSFTGAVASSIRP